MPPLSATATPQTVPEENTGNLDEDKVEMTSVSDGSTTKKEEPLRIVWRNVIAYTILHFVSLYAIYPIFTSAKWQTNAFAFFLYVFSGLGVTAGVHRLWSHGAYKAKLPLRILLALMYIIAFENDIYEWARDHRIHHKYSDTDADPHNAKRGFFFSHVGWLLVRKNPEVVKKGNEVDMSDLEADPVVTFQRKYYKQLVALCCFILPTVIPIYFWNETFSNSLLIPTIFRFIFTLNQTWLVNSAAHMFGNRPYDKHMKPTENRFVIVGALGEGFHNFHHTFPNDYATSEYGLKYNLTTTFIDLMALIGLAYDRKTTSKEVIHSRKLRTGDGNLANHDAFAKIDSVKEK